MEKPFIADKFQIAWSELKPEYIVSDITEAIETAQNQVDLISQPCPAGDDLTFENTLIALESAYESLSRPWGLVSHLDSVSNSDPLREAYNAMLPKVKRATRFVDILVKCLYFLQVIQKPLDLNTSERFLRRIAHIF